MKLDLSAFRPLNVQRATYGFRCYDNQPLTYWTTALAGEVGELCNMIKKLQRVEKGGVDGGSSYTAKDINKEMLKEEIGGIAIYLDLLASLLDIDLEEAIIDTFNSKSAKYGFEQFVKPISGGLR
ncbi:MAG TPA: MazG nucleotide pyrophosphohydrolase domain-containing protein [Chitinophagaceae bacterium]|jgi:NTP pyrophosphatase (non-canonical NTP hydrolase)|nr:MazG nucleotide pyrophosphohydrolase domain-containing protein [Chitinophagaceae bacterium]